MLVLRRAERSDIRSILELMLDQQKEDFTYDPFLEKPERVREHFEKYLRKLIESDKGFLFVAELEGEIAGYLSGKIGSYPKFAKPLRVAFIHNIFVKREFRGKGIGSALAEFALKELENCVDVFDLEVYYSNSKALEFWKTLGFKEFTIRLVKTN